MKKKSDKQNMITSSVESPQDTTLYFFFLLPPLFFISGVFSIAIKLDNSPKICYIRPVPKP